MSSSIKKINTYRTVFCLAILSGLIGFITNELLFYKVSVVLIAFYSVIRGIAEPYMINPYILFIATPISLLLYFSVGRAYMPDLTNQTWLLGIINMLSFLGAFSITKDTQHCYFDQQHQNSHLSIYILMFLGLFPAYYSAFTGKLFPLGSVINLFTIISIVKAINTKQKSTILISLALYISQFLVGYVSKMQILMLIVVLLICLEKYLIKTRRQRVILIFLSILGFFFMLYAFTFANKDRGAYDIDSGFEYYSDRIEWNYSRALFMPYMYFCTPWGNLQYVEETQNTRTYGLWAIKPLLGYLQLDDNFKEEYKMKAYSSFNTFTFIGIQFKDFGFWGSCILSILLGIYVKKIYSRYRISLSTLDVANYSLVALAVLEMFFSNHFFGLSYPFTIVILSWLYWLLTNKIKA